jgi:hypothetical protein
MDEDIPGTTLAIGEMTGPLRLASGIWMGGIEVGEMVDMNGGAMMIIVRESEMSDLLEVIGAGGCLMRGRETMVAGDNSLVVWSLRVLMLSGVCLHDSGTLYMQISSILIMWCCIPLATE